MVNAGRPWRLASASKWEKASNWSRSSPSGPRSSASKRSRMVGLVLVGGLIPALLGPPPGQPNRRLSGVAPRLQGPDPSKQ